MLPYPRSGIMDAVSNWAPLPAFADGPVADHPEPVTAEAGIVRAQTHRLDRDAVQHV